MIEVWPNLDITLPHSPNGVQLQAIGFRITGARNLVDAVSDSGERYLVDVETGPSFLTQAILNVSTGHVTNTRGHSSWHCDQLRDAFAAKEDRVVTVDVEVFREVSDVVVLNTIDDLYGHSLLKLLNASRHLTDHGPGLCVLVQRHLRQLVPTGAAEIWTVDIPAKDGVKWFSFLEVWMSQRLQHYKKVFLSRCYPHLPPAYYDLKDFVPRKARPSRLSGHSPIIAFHARDDRTWGISQSGQERRLKRLYHELKWRFPNVGFVLIGFHERTPSLLDWPGWIDLRCARISPQIESEWFQVMSHTDCAVGVHGSNMLLPSGLAKSSIELLPEFKYPVIGTTSLFSHDHHDPRQPMLTHSHLFGDSDLLEIHPERVARVIASQFYSRGLSILYSFSPANLSRGEMDTIFGDGKALASTVTSKPRQFLGRLKEFARRKLIQLSVKLE